MLRIAPQYIYNNLCFPTVTTTKKQYGHSMRHKDVRECAICAFAFYLLFRFAVSGGEMNDGNHLDFKKNEE